MAATLTDRRYRHNLEITEIAFGYAEGYSRRRASPCVSIWSICSSSSRSPRRAASRKARSRANLALASASERIKGLEEALGVSLLKRGRRGVELTAAGESLLDHARIVIHNVEAMRGDLAAFASGMRASVPLARQHVGPVGASAEGAGRLSARTSRHQSSTSRSAKASTSPMRSRPAPPISALPPNTRCPTASSGSCSARTA